MLVSNRFWSSHIISYLWLINLTYSECEISEHWGYISYLRPNLPGMRGLILVLMSNVCYLAIILIFLVVPWWLLLVNCWLLLVTARYLVFIGGYCSLLVVTARYRSLLLVPTFSMNELTSFSIRRLANKKKFRNVNINVSNEYFC